MNFQYSTFYPLVYIVIFVGALLVFDGLRQLLSREEDADQIRNRRMRMKAAGATPEDVLSVLSDQDGKAGKKRGFGRMLRQAGIRLGLGQVVLGMAALAVLAFVVLNMFMAAPIAAACAAFVGGVLPLGLLSALRERRASQIVAQLPDALELMARGLKVGHPVSVTISSIAQRMPDPIGSEFGVVEDQVAYGDDVATAFADLAARYDIEDLDYLAISVGIQHGTGGNLAHILKVLAKVIRDRASMRRKIKAISAEGRLSALILSLLPFVIFGVVNLMTPSFYGDVWDDPMFKPVMGTVLALVLTQAFILHRLVSFKF